MNKKRLLKLADFLDTVPEENFVMSTWRASKATKPETPKPGGCGFAGCALGWAAHAKLFRQLTEDRRGTPVYRKVPTARSCSEFTAAERLFDIKEAEALWLFSGLLYVTPRQEAHRIRKFVASAS